MKRFILFLLPLLGTLSANAWSGDVTVETPSTVLLLHAHEGGDLRMAYYGPNITSLKELRNAGADLNSSALPAFGTVDMVQLPALQVLHADGDLNLELKVERYELKTEDAAKTHIFTMQDKLQPVTVRVFYKAYNKVDIIETWTEIENAEKKPVTLKRFDSGHLALRQGDVWITHMHGNWAAETEPTSEPLTGGVKIIRNTDGTRNAHLDAPEVMVSLDGRPQENSGRVVGAALCWSGNFELRFNTISHKEHHFYAGIDPQSSEYILDPKQTFETPHLALTFSNEGLSGASRNFHRWARTEGMLHRGMKTGDILLNSWEGLYFNIDEARMIAMMDDISQFGGELFVMDDGWFGNKYPRKDDTSSLGDWVVDKNKLPNGLDALTKAARERGIKFGIWIEPEMVNTKSELFERHPEWALQTKGRDLKLGRGGTQLVLDMTNPKVQDFVFKIVDDLLTQNPEIAYIKWDANASIQNYGSLYLPKNRQQNLYIDYHLGCIWRRTCQLWFAAVLRRVLDFRQHRCPAARLHPVGHVALLPRQRYGLPHQSLSLLEHRRQSHPHQVPLRCRYVRTARHRVAAKGHDRRGAQADVHLHSGLQTAARGRADRQPLSPYLALRQEGRLLADVHRRYASESGAVCL